MLDRGHGHPLALAILLVEIGRRAGLPVGIVAGEHGHFIAHQRLTEPLVLDPATGTLRDADALGTLLWRCGHQVAAELLDVLQPRFERTGDLTRALHVARLRTTLPFEDTTDAEEPPQPPHRPPELVGLDHLDSRDGLEDALAEAGRSLGTDRRDIQGQRVIELVAWQLALPLAHALLDEQPLPGGHPTLGRLARRRQRPARPADRGGQPATRRPRKALWRGSRDRIAGAIVWIAQTTGREDRAPRSRTARRRRRGPPVQRQRPPRARGLLPLLPHPGHDQVLGVPAAHRR